MRAAVLAIVMAAAAGPALAASFDDAVLAEVNRVRANPAAMAEELARDRVQNRRSDPRAVEEAIAFLRRQAPLPPLRDDGRLDSAALQHVKVQGPTGQLGHGAPGDLGRRLRSQNLWAGLSAETISYGQPNPRDVVRQLVIDFDVPDRGHRQVLFSDGFSIAGVACGAHAAWGSMCVIDFAGALPPRN